MQRYFILTFIVFFTLLQNMGTAFATPPVSIWQNYQADYIVKYDSIPFGTSHTFLQQKNQHYTLCIINISTLPLFKGKVTECSQGTLQNGSVFPLHYQYNYQRENNHQRTQIDFNWQTYQATMTTNGKSWRMKIPPGTQDKISYQLELQQGLSKKQRKFEFPIADGGKIKRYFFTTTQEKLLSTALGPLKTIQVDRAHILGKEQVILWFAPTLNYQVVKVQQQKHIIDVGTAEIIRYHVKK